jgi:hypothetical protein
MTHDPLCPCYRSNRMPTPNQCQCDLIAKVREDAIAAAVQRVEALQDFWRDPYYGTDHLIVGESNDALAQAIAAIKGDQSTEDKITFIRGNDRLEQLRRNNS